MAKQIEIAIDERVCPSDAQRALYRFLRNYKGVLALRRSIRRYRLSDEECAKIKADVTATKELKKSCMGSRGARALN